MTTQPSTLERNLRAIAARAPGELGLAVRHLERGERVSINGDRPFPTCSVFKVPVLVEAFRRIGAGELSLEERWSLSEDAKSMGSGILQVLQPGLQPTTSDLLTLMITISDNTATDMIVRRLGPARITATMQALGLQSTWVDVTCRDLIGNIYGAVAAGLPRHEQAAIIRERRAESSSPSYGGGHPNDVTTPDEMADLFSWIVTGERMDAIGVDRAARQQMLQILFRQQLNDRLPRYLPGTVPFAHKTGSLGGAYEIHNDAGVLFLGDAEHVAVTAFCQAPAAPDMSPRALADLRRQMDDVIADLGLAVYEHFSASS
jgi:beta-lactamase class A